MTQHQLEQEEANSANTMNTGLQTIYGHDHLYIKLQTLYYCIHVVLPDFLPTFSSSQDLTNTHPLLRATFI